MSGHQRANPGPHPPVAAELGGRPAPLADPVADPVAAEIGDHRVQVAEVDAHEARLRTGELAGTLPAAGTSEGRQLRRWLTQLLATERVIAIEAAARGIDRPHAANGAPSEHELLPDAVARLELGSVTSAVLGQSALARALFAEVTAGVDVPASEIAAYHARNPYRYAGVRRTDSGWDIPASEPPPLDQVRAAIAADLHTAACRRVFTTWLDGRRAELVRLAPGYEHPGDPRQPDNTHKH